MNHVNPMSPEQLAKFRAAVLKALEHGAAISGVLADVRDAGWVIRGSLVDFEGLLEDAGFFMEYVRKSGAHYTIKTLVRSPK